MIVITTSIHTVFTNYVFLLSFVHIYRCIRLESYIVGVWYVYKRCFKHNGGFEYFSYIFVLVRIDVMVFTWLREGLPDFSYSRRRRGDRVWSQRNPTFCQLCQICSCCICAWSKVQIINNTASCFIVVIMEENN